MTAAQRVIKYAAIALAAVLCAAILGGLITIAGLLGGGRGDEETAGVARLWQPTEDVQALNIDLAALDLTVQTGETLSVRTDSSRLTWEIKDGTLHIREDGFVWPNRTKPAGSLTLTVPGSLVFRTAALDMGAGRVRITALAAEELTVSLGAGTADLSGVSVSRRTEIDGGAGRLTLRNCRLAALSLDMGAGQLLLDAALTGTNDIDLGVGDAQLVLRGRAEDHALHVNKGIGAITLDDRALADGETVGSGATAVAIDGGVGRVSITFAETENDT